MSIILDALNSINFNINQNKKSEVYYLEENNPVPRVTEILSKMIHSDTLMYWANSLGFKGLKYKTVLDNAAKIGTAAHLSIEKFLKEKIPSINNIPFLGFMSWYNMITEDMKLPINILFIEERLTCKWFGGTLDALMKIGDKVYLIDFKTSNHVTFKYFLQLAAYRFMLKQKKNINIDGVIVLQLNKLNIGFNEYLLDFSIIDHLSFINHCEETFLSLVYAYYNIEWSELLYKNIFK